MDPDETAVLSLGEEFTFKKMQAAFSIFKEMGVNPEGGGSGGNKGGGDSGVDQSEVDKLREMLARRDQEISILVKMAKRNNNGGSTSTGGGAAGQSMAGPSSATKLFTATGKHGSGGVGNSGAFFVCYLLISGALQLSVCECK